MSEPYLGEIRCFGFSFAPTGWAFCNGQLLAIADNEALFAILGTTYGGDGEQTFGLPNLQGQVPMHWGNSISGLNTVLGEAMGTEVVTLTTNQIPGHRHTVVGEIMAPGGYNEHLAAPAGTAFIGPSNPDAAFNKTTPTIDAPFAPNAIASNGGSQPHDNMQPYLTLNFCIALEGIPPTQS